MNEHNNFHGSHQSVYRRCNSTNITLDEGSITALTMLVLYAAIDVIDHPILLKSLESSFGIKEKGLHLDKVVSRGQNRDLF